ncbi:carboxymuconolactone decarboxylase family protein [Amycolatopsis jejuensis]|uniref:carboxymuconolactone decarboxylase family protein n=1 Tax=Amycolatopsis jejuensis TaxID=330084 RepID=UPI0005262087|nr:carboxymuconolactone decarboxylase family protein [Amycolatopsis jejuensis]
MGPRIEPVPVGEYHRLEDELFGDRARRGTANISRTWARNPGLMKAQRALQDYIFHGSTLPARHRELAILRIGWRCQSAYEFGMHTVYGQDAGLSEEDVARVTEGPDAPGWTDFEATLLRAVDELHESARISPSTWAQLAETYADDQILDLLAVVGRYWTVSVTLNSIGVEIDPGKPGFP